MCVSTLGNKALILKGFSFLLSSMLCFVNILSQNNLCNNTNISNAPLTLLSYVSIKISDPEKCDQMYESLARINSNVYKEKVRSA